MKRFLTAFFVSVIYKPGKKIARFFFYKIIVKGYCYYLSLIKRLGWTGAKGNILKFLFNQKLVHVIVVVLTIVVVFGNFVGRTNANISEKASQTVLGNLVQSEFGGLEDNELIEEFYNEEAAAVPIQQNYLEDNLTTLKSQPHASTKSVEETEEVAEAGSIVQGGSAITKQEIASTRKTKQPRTTTVSYTVQSGDTISTIAEEFEVSVNTILWENNLSSYSLIRPGQTLKILPQSGISHTVSSGENLTYIANLYKVDVDDIMETNDLTNTGQLKIGQNLIIPGGSKSTYAARTTTSYTGVSAIRDIVTSPNATPVSGNMMNWPTVGHRITQYYSWRHTGLDVANKTGTAIYAADAGTIEFVGWSNGYGYNIMINHGGGKKTRYAHLSKYYVVKGQKVGKGETIGAMGSTGWSTGPHLHFEVIISGTKYNPLNYIK